MTSKVGISMQVLSYETKYAAQIADLLNNYLPFEPESAETVEQAGGIRFLCVNELHQVIGYIAGYEIKSFEQAFPFFHDSLADVKDLIEQGPTYYSSHFVVHPHYRKLGLGSKLVEAYMQQLEKQASAVVVVGWVQSDTKKWAAERQFEQRGFTPKVYIHRYFEPYNVYCPNCAGTCYCDAHIMAKLF